MQSGPQGGKAGCRYADNNQAKRRKQHGLRSEAAATLRTPQLSSEGLLVASRTEERYTVVLTPGKQADFVYCTLDGSIAGWNPSVGIAPGGVAPSTHAVTTYVGPKGSVYTGLTSASLNGGAFLYAANFGLGRIDIFDNAFNPVTGKQLASYESRASQGDGVEEFPFPQSAAFKDDRLPNNYVPYNVQAIGDDLVVTYALHPAGTGPKETDGPGLGHVDIYSTTGKLLRRLEHGV